MNDVNAGAHGRILEWNFRPAPGLGNAHLQTMIGGLWPARPHRKILRERWELADGDFVDVDWFDADASRPWALILPGVAGNLNSPYAVRLLRRLTTAGYHAGLLNYRGMSGRPNRLATAYHAGFSHDLDIVARRLAARHEPGIVAGFSMGGSLLLKWLGETGRDAPVRAAAAISVPFHLLPASVKLGSGRWRIYDRYLTGYMRHFARQKFKRIAPPFPLPPLGRLRTLHEFDEHITAPLHGFAGADDYYERTSCFNALRRIAVPTLIINAMDDPLIPRATLPAERDLSPCITLELSAHGGHVGFLKRNGFGLPRFSLADHLFDFLADGTAANLAMANHSFLNRCEHDFPNALRSREAGDGNPSHE